MPGIFTSEAHDFVKSDQKELELLHFKKPIILIVEDDLFSQKLFSYVVSSISKDYETIVISSFKEFKSVFKSLKNVVLAIIDIHLDGKKTGLDVLNYISKEDKKIPCFLTTGLPQHKLEQLYPTIDCNVPIIKKPFMPSKCRTIIESFLD